MPELTPSLVARLHEQARAERWRLTQERFEAALLASLAHAKSAGDIKDVESYLGGLHLEDLALAVACGDGVEVAWEHFLSAYRAPMNRAAMAIDPGGGTELADSLYAELYGLQAKGGERQTLFRYFHGRSKLGTWLRAVMSQRHIDRIRATKRHDPIPEEDGVASTPMALTTEARPAIADPERARFVSAMRSALAEAIASIEPKDRLRLACYYADDMKLAAIGKMLGEHEATVSRHLTRTRLEIRAAAEAWLRDRHGMNGEAVEECFRSVAEDAGSLDLSELLGDAGARKKPLAGRSNI